MKFASFAVDGPTGPSRRLGVVDDGQLVDVTAGYAAALDHDGEADPITIARAHAPSDMTAFLERGDRAMAAAETARSYVTTHDVSTGPDGEQLRYDEDEVRLLSPVPDPNAIRDFMSVEEHVRNALGEDIPDVWFDIPIYYKADADCVGHPGQDIEWPAYTDELDYELELCAVIGKRGRDIPAAEADAYIAGYTIYNDLSARDIQFAEMEAQLGPAKGKDFVGSNVFGPYMVTPDEIDIENVSMQATVNDDVWSEGSIGAWQHSFADMIEHLTQNLYVHPGDLIGSGTVGRGCGLELGRYLEPGDEIALTVDGIGTLRNRVVKP